MVAFCPISSTAPLISDGFAKAAEWRTAPALESGVMGYADLAITLLLTVAGQLLIKWRVVGYGALPETLPAQKSVVRAGFEPDRAFLTFHRWLPCAAA